MRALHSPARRVPVMGSSLPPQLVAVTNRSLVSSGAKSTIPPPLVCAAAVHKARRRPSRVSMWQIASWMNTASKNVPKGTFTEITLHMPHVRTASVPLAYARYLARASARRDAQPVDTLTIWTMHMVKTAGNTSECW